MKKIKVVKENIYKWYATNKFENAIQYAQTCSGITGVDKYLSELQRKYQAYKGEMDALINAENPLLDDKFRVWDIMEKIKNIFKWGSVSLFVLCLIGMFAKFPAVLTILIFLIMLIGCIATIVLKVTTIVLRLRYHAYFKTVEDKATAINRKYINNVPVLYNKVDDLYLASLEPAHRETVLMRRDQERQHQEGMRVEDERLRSQKRMEEEQRKTRKASEQVLQIEQDREERYWKNRY